MLVKTVVTLVVLEVQNLVNAIWAAVASVVNGKIGFHASTNLDRVMGCTLSGISAYETDWLS